MAGIPTAHNEPVTGRGLGPSLVSMAADRIEGLCRVCLEHVAGARDGSDPEGLHDIRVAIRRLRSAMSILESSQIGLLASLREEFGEFARGTGTLRDLEVLHIQAAQHANAIRSAEPDALAPFFLDLNHSEEQARKDLQRLLDSGRLESIVLRTLDACGSLRALEPDSPPALPAISNVLQKRHRRLKKGWRRALGSGLAADLHEARILCKKLRYSVEFGQPLLGRAAERYSVTLANAQEALGLHHDASVAIDRIRQTAARKKRGGADYVMALGALAERYATQMAEAEADAMRLVPKCLGKAWRSVAERLA